VDADAVSVNAADRLVRGSSLGPTVVAKDKLIGCQRDGFTDSAWGNSIRQCLRRGAGRVSRRLT
jgi:hypothetical protein